MTQPTIKIALLTQFLHTFGFKRLVWCDGEMVCFTASGPGWTKKSVRKSSEETGDTALVLAWELTEAALEGHDQPFTLIMGACSPGEK